MKLYKFFKPDCKPCSTLAKVMDTLNLPEDLEIIPLDVSFEENKKMAYANGINQTPSLMYEDGRKMVGFRTRPELLEFLNLKGV